MLYSNKSYRAYTLYKKDTFKHRERPSKSTSRREAKTTYTGTIVQQQSNFYFA